MYIFTVVFVRAVPLTPDGTPAVTLGSFEIVLEKLSGHESGTKYMNKVIEQLRITMTLITIYCDGRKKVRPVLY